MRGWVPYYTPGEVAKLLRVTRRTVYEWLRTEKLSASRPSGRWLISEKDVAEFVGRTAFRPNPLLSQPQGAQAVHSLQESLSSPRSVPDSAVPTRTKDDIFQDFHASSEGLPEPASGPVSIAAINAARRSKGKR